MHTTDVKRARLAAAILALAVAGAGPAFAQDRQPIGVTATEIKVGNIAPYSGPASLYGVIGKTEAAYFRKVNDAGGINGRKVNFISYDDGYSPPKAVEQARKLVEDDGVLLIFHPVGTPSNAAIQKYMNLKKVPQLFVASGASRWNDPQNFPWTMGWQPNYQSEGRIYAKYILRVKPDARIAVLYQSDDFGKDYLKGLKDGLGAKASLIVAEEAYETSSPTVEAQIVKFKSLGADVFVNVTTNKFAAQAIRKAGEIGWKPLHILNNNAISIGSVMKPAGLENGQGIVSVAYLKDPNDPQWRDDAGMKAYFDFLAKYMPAADKSDSLLMYAYSAAQTLEYVLAQCGGDLTRENIMKQAASIKGLQLPGLLPGILVSTSATDFAPIEQLQLMTFKGERWELFGEVLSGATAD